MTPMERVSPVDIIASERERERTNKDSESFPVFNKQRDTVKLKHMFDRSSEWFSVKFSSLKCKANIVLPPSVYSTSVRSEL